MKLLTILLLTSALMAVEPQPVTVESLQTEITVLRAQLKEALDSRNAAVASCWTTDIDVVQTRFTAALSGKAAKETAIKAEEAKKSTGKKEDK